MASACGDDPVNTPVDSGPADTGVVTDVGTPHRPAGHGLAHRHGPPRRRRLSPPRGRRGPPLHR
ncbi:MAG: hypothetical protein IPN17_04330 [Deltaproteobacteria bacterium]|nr:hypothetical protein [Deltaproteobacteria bacterium]